jgi:hypothetical protein
MFITLPRALSTMVVSATVSVCVAACATPAAPAATAAQVARMQCDVGAAAQADIETLRATTVVGVEPLYSHILSGNNNSEERVNGAKLYLRPRPDVTSEQLMRVLRCHGARALLAQLSGAAVPDDPYWLADTWVDIDVRVERGNLVATLSADSVPNGLLVLGRANRYAGEHMLASAPVLP